MSELVKRLRAEGQAFRGDPDDIGPCVTLLVEEAADEITRLTARVAELEAMLRTASDMNEVYEGRLQELEGALKQINVGEGWAALIARAALTQPAPEKGGE
jgi:phage shock protein A